MQIVVIQVYSTGGTRLDEERQMCNAGSRGAQPEERAEKTVTSPNLRVTQIPVSNTGLNASCQNLST